MIRRVLATTAVMAAILSVVAAMSSSSGSPDVSAAVAEFVPLAAPQRLLDSRPTGGTDDGLFAGIGVRPSGSILELKVTGRAGVPGDAESVALNVTTDAAVEDGFVTVFPCGSAVPNASNLNYAAGQTIANAVIARIGVDGKVCLYNFGATNLIADVTGYFPAGAFSPLSEPQRLLDSRPTGGTDDGLFAGIGLRAAHSTLELTVAGRAGVPANAAAVALNVTVDAARGGGFVTVFPCGAALPTASNLNYVTGQTIANAVVARVGTGGAVCFYTDGATDLIVDVTGVFSASTLNALDAPQRFMDTRPGQSTIDGLAAGGGIRPADGTYQLTIAGRGGVPANASAVILNVTADAAAGDGFVTVYPRGTGRPNASNLNYRQGQTIANAAIARVGAAGQICLYTFGSTHLIVDVAGWLTGPAPPSSGTACPADPPPPTTTTTTAPPPAPLQPGTTLIGSGAPPGRYIARSSTSGCYWERLSGLGGTLGEIIANDFQGFSGRIIVDIAGTDLAFRFDAECGTFSPYTLTVTPATTIPPGDWVVGSEIVAGTYAATVASGCYWERVTSFAGTLDSVIANDFIATPGSAYVTIAASDIGFKTDADCGTWSRIG